MKTFLLVACLSFIISAGAQVQSGRHMEDENDTTYQSYCWKHGPLLVPKETILYYDSFPEQYMKDGLMYIFHSKRVPMGYYSDTSIKDLGITFGVKSIPLYEIQFDAFMDRRPVVHINFFGTKGWYSLFVDTAYLKKIK